MEATETFCVKSASKRILERIMGLYRVILALYRDNGKENGNYYSRIGYIWEVKIIVNPFIPIIDLLTKSP